MTTSRSSRIRRITGLAALGLTLGLAACGAGGGSSAHPAEDDVRGPVACTARSNGTIRAKGDVVNHSSEPSFYAIDVRFSVDGQGVSTHTATIESLDPGARRRFEIAELHAPDGFATCTVASVTRLKA